MVKISQVIKESNLILKRNTWPFLSVIVVLNVFFIALARQISSWLLDLILLAAGVEGINNENILWVLQNFWVVLLLLLVLFVAACAVVAQISLIVGISSRPYQSQRRRFSDLFRPLLTLNPRVLLYFWFYVFVVLLFGNIGLAITVGSNLSIPLFIMNFIHYFRLLSILYYLFVAVMIYLNARYFYTFAIFYHEDYNFKDSMKRSWQITSGKSLKMLILSLGSGLAGLLLIAIWNLIVYGLLASLISSVAVTALIYEWGALLILVVASVYTVQLGVIGYHKEENHKPVFRDNPKDEVKGLGLANLLALVLLLSFGVYTVFHLPANLLSGSVRIISHRGEKNRAVENTIPSLVMAHESGADLVEFDVIEIADQTPIVFHDVTLRRLANDSRAINTLTWEEVEEIVLNSNGNTASIPSLAQYLAKAKELGQDLLIEIKTSSRDSDEFLDNVYQEVERTGMKDHVLYQSNDKEAILKFSAKYPDALTGYIIAFNIGGLTDMDVDFFAIESSSVTARVRNDVQMMRKGLFVWSVESKEVMELFFRSSVNGIITDQVEKAIEVRDSIFEFNLIDGIGHFFTEMQ